MVCFSSFLPSLIGYEFYLAALPFPKVPCKKKNNNKMEVN